MCPKYPLDSFTTFYYYITHFMTAEMFADKLKIVCTKGKNDSNPSKGEKSILIIKERESMCGGRSTEPHSTFPPRVIDRRANLIVKEGSTVKLPCAAEGYPIPQIHWLKLEKSQAVRLSKNQRFVELGGTLIIRRAEPEDSGKYICYVNNSVADERVDTELLVS
ncbi:hypothetical protein AVEN_136208-1, partial [Araneus ventricosus]